MFDAVDDLDVWRARHVIAAHRCVFRRWLNTEQLLVVGNAFEVFDRPGHTNPQSLNGVLDPSALCLEVGLKRRDIGKQLAANPFEFRDLSADWFAHLCSFGLRCQLKRFDPLASSSFSFSQHRIGSFPAFSARLFGLCLDRGIDLFGL